MYDFPIPIPACKEPVSLSFTSLPFQFSHSRHGLFYVTTASISSQDTQALATPFICKNLVNFHPGMRRRTARARPFPLLLNLNPLIPCSGIPWIKARKSGNSLQRIDKFGIINPFRNIEKRKARLCLSLCTRLFPNRKHRSFNECVHCEQDPKGGG